GERRPGAGLALLSAEAAAHPPRLDGDEGVGQAENARDDVLDLGRVLGRAIEGHLARFARHGERHLPFEIEMFLAADAERAVEPARRRGERALHVATAV